MPSGSWAERLMFAAAAFRARLPWATLVDALPGDALPGDALGSRVMADPSRFLVVRIRGRPDAGPLRLLAERKLVELPGRSPAECGEPVEHLLIEGGAQRLAGFGGAALTGGGWQQLAGEMQQGGGELGEDRGAPGCELGERGEDHLRPALAHRLDDLMRRGAGVHRQHRPAGRQGEPGELLLRPSGEPGV